MQSIRQLKECEGFSGRRWAKQRPLRLPKTLRLENEESNPKASIWLTLARLNSRGLKLVFRLRVSQIDGFGLLFFIFQS